MDENIFETIEKLLDKKRNMQNLTNDDLEAIEIIDEMLNNKICFFEVDMETIVGMLFFLGVEADKLEEYYYKIISPENYTKLFPRQTYAIEE